MYKTFRVYSALGLKFRNKLLHRAAAKQCAMRGANLEVPAASAKYMRLLYY